MGMNIFAHIKFETFSSFVSFFFNTNKKLGAIWSSTEGLCTRIENLALVGLVAGTEAFDGYSKKIKNG